MNVSIVLKKNKYKKIILLHTKQEGNSEGKYSPYLKTRKGSDLNLEQC
jgi:hypothetical protein